MQTHGTNNQYKLPPLEFPLLNGHQGESYYCKTTDDLLSEVENKVTKMFSEIIFTYFSTHYASQTFLCL